KTNYKELTYILISIPAAVALLLILINIYQLPKHEKIKVNIASANVASEIKTSESPYAGVLGKSQLDTASKSFIKIKNPSDNDVIVFLRDGKNKVVRHHFIEPNYQLYIEQLPAGTYNLCYYVGNGFTNSKYLFSNIIGNFSRVIAADSFPQSIKVVATKPDSFVFTIPNNTAEKIDTLLLKRIFNRN
ncbi:MAG TPA: hypothetical protein VKG26_00975, partial [Bacteroidia bacterium]|nr:hypothetical protein [Bacteroidia bacterium]